jgi:hypothetical protein
MDAAMPNLSSPGNVFNHNREVGKCLGRLDTDFELVDVIGVGHFGRVTRMRNLIDNCEYGALMFI